MAEKVLLGSTATGLDSGGQPGTSGDGDLR
jgi:hypothetical protein